MHQVTGSCHCGNVSVSIELPRDPIEYSPRACDCDFCRKHGASYFSDPDGTLCLTVRSRKLLHEYRQGSRTAEMLVCANCGVLIGGMFRTDAGDFAAINTRIVDAGIAFGDPQTASPKLLDVEEKAERWRRLWFRSVTMTFSKRTATRP
jgi:hypothetical protein